MEQMIRECKMGSKASLGNGWIVENNSACGFKFYKEGVLIDTFIMKASAIDFAEKNCKAEKSEAEMLCEISKKFFTDTKATRKDGSLVIADIVSLSGGDAIRDAGGERIEFQPITYEFLKSWADKNGTDFETVCKAINF
jgi:hypothetical protein